MPARRYVLRADLEVLYGRRFTEAHAPRLVQTFGEWVRNIANGQLVGFFDELGCLLREEIVRMQANPEAYADERSVLSVYLEHDALEKVGRTRMMQRLACAWTLAPSVPPLNDGEADLLISHGDCRRLRILCSLDQGTHSLARSTMTSRSSGCSR